LCDETLDIDRANQTREYAPDGCQIGNATLISALLAKLRMVALLLAFCEGVGLACALAFMRSLLYMHIGHIVIAKATLVMTPFLSV
jgi:hypothetical protein